MRSPMLESPRLYGDFLMDKEIAIAAATLAGGVAFVVHPHAAIGAAVGCCFLATPWAAGNLAWWRRLLLSVFSYGMGYAAGAEQARLWVKTE